MNKMREAFEKWIWEDVLHRGLADKPSFEAGYQAAIAAVKEGGAVGYTCKVGLPAYQANLRESNNPDKWEPLYKLPEDTP